jgi:isopentenyl diphosphate isomerase/L-lactate dehydrogenase-like FMN-dependent dehydrogenase
MLRLAGHPEALAGEIVPAVALRDIPRALPAGISAIVPYRRADRAAAISAFATIMCWKEIAARLGAKVTVLDCGVRSGRPPRRNRPTTINGHNLDTSGSFA